MRGYQEKKHLKTPTTGAQGIETLTPKQLQMHKSQLRVKQQDTHSPSKANSTTKDPNTSTKEELLNKEFQKTVVKMNKKRKTKISV
jgi:hypothetical protein